MKEKVAKALELLDEARALFEDLESDAHDEWVRAEEIKDEWYWEEKEFDFGAYAQTMSDMHEEISKTEL